jgi:hypothetical protein
MNKSEYVGELEELFETVEFDYEHSLINTLASKAKSLEEDELEEEDIYEEILAIVPDSISEELEMLDIVRSLADLIYSEQDDSEESEEEDE